MDHAEHSPNGGKVAPISESRIVSLDGVRGLAILTVMLGHIGEFGLPIHPAFNAVFAMSWVGVELFFVLSGFLITSILIEKLNTKNYFSRFYLRRFLRIVPVYYLVLTVTTYLFPLIFNNLITPDMSQSWQQHAPWYYAFLANIMMMQLGDMPHDPVAVAWSLAVEEQFYLVWPFVALGFRYFRPLTILGSLLIGGIILRAILMMNGWADLMFYLFTPTRMDSLILGAALAVARHYGWMKASWHFAWVGYAAAALLVTMRALSLVTVGFDEANHVVLAVESLTYYTLIAVVFASLIGHLLTKSQSRLAGWMSKKWLCQIGLWSYPIYLTHNLINHALANSGFTFGVFGSNLVGLGFHAGVTFAVAVGVGYLLHRWIERPILGLKASF